MEYAWTKKILDFTILELNGSQWGAVRSSILINRSNDRPFIHHFNPFKNEYTKKIWTALMITLFPNKLTDMSGYPMRILPVNVPPYILAGFNGSAVTSVGGPNSVLMLILLQSLNATPEYDAGLRRLDSSDLLRTDHTDIRKRFLRSSFPDISSEHWNHLDLLDLHAVASNKIVFLENLHNWPRSLWCFGAPTAC
ncbi:uncharacterized protein [Venturia canescens]|uniref:uncharacterized protein n=1 Tax=Venturia canescens TaxID=32260 RepID=UPI001C9BFF85|nr:uncharacterized protein LOC122410603 [Venturia canescens]